MIRLMILDIDYVKVAQSHLTSKLNHYFSTYIQQLVHNERLRLRDINGPFNVYLVPNQCILPSNHMSK